MTAATGSVPAVPPALRAQATRQRGGYVYAIDPYFDPAGAVPPCGIVGGWSVDHSGQLVSFTHNPKYRPSPIALEFPAPLTALDAAVQRAVTGYGSEAELLAAFRDATLILFAQEGQDGLYTVADDDGGRYIPAFTHRDHTPGAWQQWRQATEATAGSGSGNARVRERRDDALALARGPLPADRPKGRYTWLSHEVVETQLLLLVADVALALSGHHLEAGNPAPALDALDTALTHAPADERLWNGLLRAAHATGDTARLESTAAALVARHHELSGGARGLPPRTEALLDELLPAWREARSAAD